MSISVALVDDETIARARLRRLLSSESDFAIVAECADGVTAIDVIQDRAPDVVFLDVQMPGCDGFQVVRSIPESELPIVVFVTAYDAHALRAFEVSAIDYLLKPFDGERLKRTLDRIRRATDRSLERRQLLAAIDQLTQTQRRIEQTAPPVASGAPPGSRYRDRLVVRRDGKTHLIAVRDVDFIESAANYVRVHVGGESHLLREPISALALDLDPLKFARIHRRTIVNINRVREIEPWFSGDAIITLKDGHKLRLSRSHRAAFQRAVGGTA